MSTTKLISMYLSPWSERVRFGFAFKRFPYEKQDYRPGVDEEELKKLTGQNQVPVLVMDGKVIPDSTAILDWLEAARPEPALVPKSDKDWAQVTLWEELIEGVMGPHARTLLIGRGLRSSDPELQGIGKFFAAKYGHSEYAEDHARLTLKRVLLSIKHTIGGRQYLVGDAFSRADLTAAAMLMLMRPPPDELFLFPRKMRPLFTDPLSDDPECSAVFAWRNEMYKRHRGEPVKP
jgi:glutathione S-transferase